MKLGVRCNALSLLLSCLAPAMAAGGDDDRRPLPEVGRAVHFGQTPAIADLPRAAPAPDMPSDVATRDGDGDVRVLTAEAMDPPLTTFEGLSNFQQAALSGAYVYPPDANGDVGPNHYVQAVNFAVQIFDRTGAPLTQPFQMSDLFASGACATNDDGRPIVLYDHLSDRWLLSQAAILGGPPFHQCIAISQTGNPTLSWFVWDFVMPGNLQQDLAKIGLGHDAYYMAADQPQQPGGVVLAFDRLAMLAGNPIVMFIYFDLFPVDPAIDGLLPADLDGPGADRPGLFALFTANEFGDPQGDGLRLWEFAPNFADPPSSTFTELPSLSVDAFDPLSPVGRADIPQPGTAVRLDSNGGRLMHRLQYRNFGTHESLVTNHTVDVSGDPTAPVYRAGVRYYELRRTLPSGSWTVHEEATHAPADTVHRWLGSAALDNDGNLAVGFSVSDGATTFPGIRYAGRLAGDTPGGLAQGEQTLISGSGIQTGPANRWGDYSMLAVDPVDDCTFWYTNEYYSSTPPACASASICWQTRVGTFKFASCTPPPKGTLSGTVTKFGTSSPIAGAMVQLTSGYTTFTDGSGNYSFSVPAATYDATASKTGYASDSATGVTVTSGNTTDLDFQLHGMPILEPFGAALDDSAGNGNGNIDIDECFEVELTVENTGGGPATGISATLSTTTPNLTVVSDASAYPDVPVGATGANTTPFRLQTAPGFVAGIPVHLSLTLTTDQGPHVLNFTGVSGTPNPIAPIFFSSGPVPIPDLSAVGAVLNFNVSGLTTAISKVRVLLYLTHTYDSDLEIHLIGPDSTDVLLADNRGGPGDNFGTDCPNGDFDDTIFEDAALTPIASGSAPFVGSFLPEQPLAAFYGKSGSAINGTWKLKVIDQSAQDVGNIECAALIIHGHLTQSMGGACAPKVAAHALAVDVAGNGILEVGESASVAPTWKNVGGVVVGALTGNASNFVGPPGPTYTLSDATAAYGSLALLTPATCVDCYAVQIAAASRPATHWDARLDETPSIGPAKTWALHVGGSFADVPPSSPFYGAVETLLHRTVTAGCSAGAYCPADSINRQQMAVFVLKSKEGATFVPPACVDGAEVFGDVPFSSPYCPWIEELFRRGVVEGCGGDNYCPLNAVNRQQIALFMLKGLAGGAYAPPNCIGGTEIFADVSASSPFCPWIEELFNRGVVAGCGGGNFCAANPVTREQMGVFLRETFGLQLYRP